MKMKLLRLTPRVNNSFIFALIDIEIEDIRIRLKGIRMTLKGSQIMLHMPYLLTEKGIKYTPFNFLKEDDWIDFKKSLMELIQKEYPLTLWEKGIYDIDNLPKITT